MTSLIRENERIIIRPIKIFDFLGFYLNIRDKQVSMWTSEPKNSSDVVSLGDYIKIWRLFRKGFNFILQSIFHVKDDKVFRFAIKVKGDNLSAGIVTITLMDNANVADIGFWIGKKYWGKGYMSQVVSLSVDIAFSEIGIELLKAWTYDANIGSIRVLKKNGFNLVNIEKEKYKIYGQWHDRYNFELAKEFL